MRKLLMVVDPQIDFINGSLPVGGASEAMDRLAEYIMHHDGEYCFKIVTTDWHPYNHCSFTGNGGEWPAHCIQNTAGAAVYQPLVKPLYTTAGSVKVLRKGVFAGTEEYSIFKNQISAKYIDDIVRLLNVGRIDLCGIAGDICVYNTLVDGMAIYGGSMFSLLKDFCPSIDGGTKLSAF